MNLTEEKTKLQGQEYEKAYALAQNEADYKRLLESDEVMNGVNSIIWADGFAKGLLASNLKLLKSE